MMVNLQKGIYNENNWMTSLINDFNNNHCKKLLSEKRK